MVKKICGILLPVFLFALISFIYYGAPLGFNWAHQYLGLQSEPLGTMWWLKWHQYILQHHLNPFYTKLIWAPFGYNMVQTQSMPLLGFLSIPLLMVWGPVATYNFLIYLMSVFAGCSMYALCRYLTRSTIPSSIGGYLFAYSPYMVAQSYTNLCLSTVFILPLLILIGLLYWDRKMSAGLYSFLLGLGLSIYYFIGHAEVYFLFGFCGFLFLLWLFLLDKDNRKKIGVMMGYSVLGGLISLIIMSPFIYHFFAAPANLFYKNIEFDSIDLLNFFIPNRLTWLGGNFFHFINIRFRPNLWEAEAYLGLPFILLLFLFAREFWKKPAGKAFVLFILTLMLASLGPVLHIRGHVPHVLSGVRLHLPWFLFMQLPVLKWVEPDRFTHFLFLSMAILIPLWLTYSKWQAKYKYALVIIGLLFLLPNPYPKNINWISKINMPRFFSTSIYKNIIPQHSIVLTLPYDGDGSVEPIFWQLKSDFYFHLANGLTAGPPLAVEQMKVGKLLLEGNASEISISDFKDFLKKMQVKTILIQPEYFKKWLPLLSQLPVQPKKIGDLIIYILP